MTYYLYILECSDHSLYTGITTNLNRRLHEHNETKKGAKYTRIRRPVKIVYSKEYEDRSKASKAEYELKSLTREEKLKVLYLNL